MKKVSTLLLMLITFTMLTTQAQTTKFVIKTEFGQIKGFLYNDTPKHRDNFIKLVNEGWFNNSNFHRIINSFMIQGGMNADGRQDPGYTVPAEINLKYIHKKGALAAARMGDQVNPQKASSGSQFYIVQGKKADDAMLSQIESRGKFTYTPEQKDLYKTIGGTPHLDNGYTVFGEITEGLDVVDKIAAVKTLPGDRPEKPVLFSIELVK